MTLDTGAGPGVALPRSAGHPADLDTDATRALALVTVDPFTGAARAVRSPVPAPPAALAPTGRVAPRPRVTAVLVSRDGEQRLARTLAAVAAQTRRPDLLVAADTGSADRSTAMLATATPHVLRLGRKASFADAVQGAVAALVARTTVREDPRPEPGGAGAAGADGTATGQREGEGRGQQTTEWLWLLHDDGAPAPDALARLLEAVETAPSVAVAGCKQVDWDDDQHLLDVGFTTSTLGARVTGLDPREVDQGQHDARSDVLAVSTAGMLVRRDVWQALGGPDPLLAHARDDVDLCHRVRLAGHRVVVVPGAVVAHAGSGPAGEPSSGRSWYRADRRDALHLRLAGAHAGLVPVLWLWTALAAPVRSLWRLVLKQPDRAVDELVAAAVVLATPRRWLRSRARTRRAQTVPRDTLKPLLATRRAIVRRHRDALAAWAAATLSVEAPAGVPTAATSVPTSAPTSAPTAAPTAGEGPDPVAAPRPGWGRRRLQRLLAVRAVAPAVSGAPTLAEVVDADRGRVTTEPDGDGGATPDGAAEDHPAAGPTTDAPTGEATSEATDESTDDATVTEDATAHATGGAAPDDAPVDASADGPDPAA
uniref:glycosyltransferase n=1 Tax=Kineosporia sp. R_H_3 TaxID=1961848 RepID=UPI00117BBB47